MANYDEYGNEIADETPLEVPLSFKKPLTLAEEVRRMVKNEMSQMAESQGAETFEEADDFEVEDEDDLAFMSPYEIMEMTHDGPPESLEGNDREKSDGTRSGPPEGGEPPQESRQTPSSGEGTPGGNVSLAEPNAADPAP